jgi:hypothetical protein
VSGGLFVPLPIELESHGTASAGYCPLLIWYIS